MTLERLIRQLVTVLESRDPNGLHRPVPIADLRQRVLPYRVHRPALGLSSNDDYELLVLRLVAEEDGWVRTFPPEAAERARRELGLAIPDLDLTETLGDATIQIGAPALARLKAEAAGRANEWATDPPAAAVAPPPVPDEPAAAEPVAPASTPDPEPPLPPPAPPPPIPLFERLDAVDLVAATAEPVERAPIGPPAAQARCAGCGGQLPLGRSIVYCPHCGRQIGARRCVRCEALVEPGWRHCVMCGHGVLEIDPPVA
jgi:hypothetical protein